jgi:isoleucyl-tRNA synthetase
MDALLRLVSLGSAARNSVKIKVRQPLAQMWVCAANEHEQRAVRRFADQITEELNIKTVTLQEPGEPSLLQFEAKANAKTLGPKLGAQLSEVQKALAVMPPLTVYEKLQSGQAIEVACTSGSILIESSDILGQWKAPEGYAGVANGATQVVIDVRITEQLAQEGMAREAVRHIQELRKKAKLEPEDRIELYVHTDSPALANALSAHKEYIGNETLATKWAAQPLVNGAEAGDAHATDAGIDGQTLRIELKRHVAQLDKSLA